MAAMRAMASGAETRWPLARAVAGQDVVVVGDVHDARVQRGHPAGIVERPVVLQHGQQAADLGAVEPALQQEDLEPRLGVAGEGHGEALLAHAEAHVVEHRRDARGPQGRSRAARPRGR